MKISNSSKDRATLVADLRRAEARATFMRLQQEMAKQDREVTADEAADLARRVVDDTMEDLVRQGKIRFVGPNDQGI